MISRLRERLRKEFALFGAVALAGLVPIVMPSAATAGDCRCEFADSKWQAYATDVACTILMHKGNTSCEIEFGGLGATDKLISSVLGRDPANYKRHALDVLNTYLSYFAKGDSEGLTSPGFLSEALPIFIAGAYLRGSPDDTQINKAKRVNAAVAFFVSKNSETVSDVFRGKQGQFTLAVDSTKFLVGKGFIVIDDGDDHLVTRYLSGS